MKVIILSGKFELESFELNSPDCNRFRWRTDETVSSHTSTHYSIFKERAPPEISTFESSGTGLYQSVPARSNTFSRFFLGRPRSPGHRAPTPRTPGPARVARRSPPSNARGESDSAPRARSSTPEPRNLVRCCDQFRYLTPGPVTALREPPRPREPVPRDRWLTPLRAAPKLARPRRHRLPAPT